MQSADGFAPAAEVFAAVVTKAQAKLAEIRERAIAVEGVEHLGAGHVELVRLVGDESLSSFEQIGACLGVGRARARRICDEVLAGAREVVTPTVAALERELAELGERASGSVMAASARSMARMLDDPKTVGTPRTAASRELRETLAVLKAEATPEKPDRLSELEARRARRMA